MKHNKNILVLGARGMLGQTVLKYLKSINKNTFGTDKNSNNFYFLSAETVNRDFKKILNDIKEIDFVINCIGIIEKERKSEMNKVNTKFVKELSVLADKYDFKLIHISTDAVFPSNIQDAFENTKPTPDTYYGLSKLKGEVNKRRVINIRTSIIGFDKVSHKGLLEWVKKEKTINGYVNQIWTGCTTLQFAKLCEFLIKKDNFEKVRSKSNVFHYTPIGPISKYQLIKTYINISGQNKKINKTSSPQPIDRRLKSIYNVLPKKKDINKSFSELIDFSK